jgi:hypothetical protein
MAIVELYIPTDRKEVKYATTLQPKCGEYGLYQGKIWKVTKKETVDYETFATIEREKANEKMNLSGKELKELLLIVYPQGHINV